jgi:hypothetical protein
VTAQIGDTTVVVTKTTHARRTLSVREAVELRLTDMAKDIAETFPLNPTRLDGEIAELRAAIGERRIWLAVWLAMNLQENWLLALPDLDADRNRERVSQEREDGKSGAPKAKELDFAAMHAEMKRLTPKMGRTRAADQIGEKYGLTGRQIRNRFDTWLRNVRAIRAEMERLVPKVGLSRAAHSTGMKYGLTAPEIWQLLQHWSETYPPEKSGN